MGDKIVHDLIKAGRKTGVGVAAITYYQMAAVGQAEGDFLPVLRRSRWIEEAGDEQYRHVRNDRFSVTGRDHSLRNQAAGLEQLLVIIIAHKSSRRFTLRLLQIDQSQVFIE